MYIKFQRLSSKQLLQFCSERKSNRIVTMKTSSPKGNDRSPESQHVIKIFLASSQVNKRFFSEVQEQLTPQSMV